MILSIYSLDVLGHSPVDCSLEFRCPCINIHDENMHNEARCECGFEINDQFLLGSYNHDGYSESELLSFLQGLELIDSSATMNDIRIDDDAMGLIEIISAKDDRPLLHLTYDAS